MSGRFVAVGDIHGYVNTLQALLLQLELLPGDTLLTVGDHISKGPGSKEVIDCLLQLRESGIRLIPLMGNHESMFIDSLREWTTEKALSQSFPSGFIDDAYAYRCIPSNGFQAVCSSYGWGQQPESWLLPQSHREFFASIKTHHIERNCLFIHAGLGREASEKETVEEAINTQLQDPHTLLWTRYEIDTPCGFKELIVHGHTPLFTMKEGVEVNSLEPWKDQEWGLKSVVFNNRLNLDSGVSCKSYQNGHLTCVEIPEDGNPAKLVFYRQRRVD